MQLTASQDLEAPLEAVFRHLTDVQRLERQAMRRGVEVQRVGATDAPAVGSAWDIRFPYRGSERHLRTRIVEVCAPESVALETRTAGIRALTYVELTPLAPGRTRLAMASELTSDSLKGRLLIRSLWLAKGRLTERLQAGLRAFAADLENATASGAPRSGAAPPERHPSAAPCR